MQTEDLIPVSELCTCHHIEFTFVRTLHDSGLIGMTVREGTAFLSVEELPLLEKFIRWHYELAINPEGIEAISHLLSRVEGLQEEISSLRNKLRRYETGEPHAFVESDL
jgi:chaperone modulatory protein CbpM